MKIQGWTILICLVWFPVFAMAADPLPQTGEVPAKPSEPIPTDAQNPGPSPDKPVMRDIHDIKPPEPAPPDMRRMGYYALIGLAILVVLGLLIGLLRRLRWRKAAPAPPPPPPEKLAESELDRLAEVNAWQDRAFYFALSAILRRYLRGRYRMDAPEMTTEELLPRLQGHLDRPHYDGLQRFFRFSDGVKFAGAMAGERQMAEDLKWVRRFVRETTPAEPSGPDRAPEKGAGPAPLN